MPVTTRLLPTEPVDSLDAYLATDIGGLGLQRAQQIGPRAVIDAVTASGLRGRGGAGFPTGRKWAGVAGERGFQRYLVCNGAEGEPATFKDRALMRNNPYQLIEGVLIAAFAIDAVAAYVCVKESFERELEALTRAAQEMQDAGLCRDCPITFVAGPPDYLYGEEKAMLEVIEGKPAMPRVLAPHEHGLFAGGPQEGWESVAAPTRARGAAHDPHPTVVNNVETLSNVPGIVVHGPDWFRQVGTAESPGTAVCTIVGDVRHAGVAEVELGATTLREAIDTIGGGVREGRRVRAVLSGVSNPVLTEADLDTPLSYEAMSNIGRGLGAAGFWVIDDSACMIDVALQASRFLAFESCGQCPACKLGSAEITVRLDRLRAGTSEEHDIDELGAWLARVTDGNRCYLAVEEQTVVRSILTVFSDEVHQHARGRPCPTDADRPLPLIRDLVDGSAVLAPIRG